MDYIQSNSQESLSSKIREVSKNDLTTKELVEYVKTTCETRKLDFDKVAEEIISALGRTQDIRNTSAFVRAVVGKLPYEKFKIDRKTPCFLSLHRAFERNGIVGKTWELFLIDSIEEHCLNEFHVAVEDLQATNMAIIEYCKQNGKKTLGDFKEFLLKSKALKHCNIPIVILEKKAKENADSWDTIMKDLEEDQSLYGENQ